MDNETILNHLNDALYKSTNVDNFFDYEARYNTLAAELNVLIGRMAAANEENDVVVKRSR